MPMIVQITSSIIREGAFWHENWNKMVEYGNS